VIASPPFLARPKEEKRSFKNGDVPKLERLCENPHPGKKSLLPRES
jgi:hypothetical protein